ncbi:MAG: class I SAM-dependent methyltransferase [Opitutaceae bacterium]
MEIAISIVMSDMEPLRRLGFGCPEPVEKPSTPQQHFVRDYSEHLARLRTKLQLDDAMRAAVGGEFEAVGRLELALLKQYELGDEPAFIVDVGCGSGRLAAQLAASPNVRYVGTDIMPDLLSFAQRLCERPDWRFIPTNGCSIPVADNEAGYVCFFSVFTHLLHQETYRYLQEAKRVLKPGGLILFTFLEFRLPCHWAIFERSLEAISKSAHLDQFMSRDAIEAWAEHLDLEIVQVVNGDMPHIPLSSPIAFEDGRVMEGMGNLGQSVAVLRRKQA